MATEYKLSYTAAEIDERLGNVSRLSENVGTLETNVGTLETNVDTIQTDVGTLQTDVQKKAEVMTLSTDEYEALEDVNANTIYVLTDSDDVIIPSVAADDEGKFLRVVNGTPTWTTIVSASETTF